MLIIIMILMAIVCLYVICVKKDSISFLLLGLCLSFIIMFIGIIIYIAKSGGFSQSQRFFLFLIPSIQVKLQYLPISPDRLGYMVAIGRFTFPIILLSTAMHYSMVPAIRKRLQYMKWLILPTVFWLIYYYPKVFREVVRGRYFLQAFMIKLAFVWISLCIVSAITILLIEYRSITIPFCKRHFRWVILSYLSITLLYSLYCIQDPAQIYQTYGVDYMWIRGISYTTSAMSTFGWIGLTCCGIFFILLGSFSIAHYTQVKRLDEKNEVLLQHKFDTSNMGATVFVHSMKNQLLANRVVNKKIIELLEEPEPDLEKLKGYTRQLNELNEGMLRHMEELYKSIKNNAMYLMPVSITQPVQLALIKFHEKYPEYEVQVSLKTKETVLADETHLSEAIYNLLTNGYEAAVEAHEDQGKVELIIYSERLYTVIEVRDNGKGLSKEKLGKIFDPFFTSKNTNYNWGMGLYYVKKIIKGHLGSLRVESIENEGTHMFILLPKFSENT